MNKSVQPQLQLPDGTRKKLDEFRKRVWAIKIIEGLGAAVFGLLLSYLLVFVIDRFIDTPVWVRGVLLLIGTAGLGILFPLKCHRWVWRTRRFDQLARLLKHRMPRVSDRMLGIIELAENEVEQQRSATLVQAALRQVDEDIRDQTFVNAVPQPRHRLWAWGAAVPCALAFLLLLLVPDAGTNALKRWLMPWIATQRYTFAQLDELPEKLVVPYSEEFELGAKLSEETAWAPERAVAQIGKQTPVETERQQNEFRFPMPPQKQDGVITLTVGDAKTNIPVEPKLRPELTELVAKIKLPDYLQYADTLTRDARGGTISLVRGSEANLLATASRELASATLNGVAQEVKETRIETSGTRFDDSKTLHLSWEDQFGLTSKQPFELNVETNDDLAPTIVCSQLSRQQIVKVDEVLTFEVTADDDFGVKEIGIQWQGIEDPLTNPDPAKGETIITAGRPQDSELKVQASFCAAREGIPPQTLQVRLYAVDYLPSRERVYSPPYTLFVLSPQDHANWLTEQLRRWSRKAQEVYERENQLYEENKALRGLAPEELGKKETRDRIETQAIAERANARQLNAVTAAGRQLIAQAVKNDQFNVMTMEGLAEMVKTLDELAKNRMPSVADLLKTAANAPDPSDEPLDGSGEESSDGPKPPTVGNNRDPNNRSKGGNSEEGKQEESKPKPSIADIESSMNQSDDDEDADEEQQSKKPGQKGEGKFGLASTTVLGGGPKPDKQPVGVEEESIEEALDEAIEEQEDLLEEFTKIAEELQRILDNLEGSTFVKRLKAASRRQLEVAEELNQSLSEKFGRRPSQLDSKELESSVAIADREEAESDNLSTIKADLAAYYSRVQQGKFRTVVVEMDQMEVTSALENVAGLVTDNLHGQSIAHAEFWADTFDRWAEQLVGPG